MGANSIPFIRPLRPGALAAVDVLLAIGLAPVCVYSAMSVPLSGLHEKSWLSWLVGLGLGLPIAVRRRWPLPVAVVVTTIAITALATGIIADYAAAPAGIATACALYTLGLLGPAVPAMMVAGLAMTGVGTAVFGASLVRGGSADASYAVLAGLVPVLGWIIGITIRDRRAHATQELEQRTAQAVHEERLRIARELHDIVAHSMSLIAVKAAVANHVADDRPQETRHALSVIEATSRVALADLRRALGVLRTTAPYAPMPGLAGLAALAEQARTTGLRVDLTMRDATSLGPPEHEGPSRKPGLPEISGPADTSGPSPNWDPGTQAPAATHEPSEMVVSAGRGTPSGTVESASRGTPSGMSEGLALAAYRIVQESLTNVVKHSRATSCVVTVTTEAGGLRIQVRDDGPGPASASGGGQGIIGMRERAALYGGELMAAPDPSGGFVVDAWLPNGSPAAGATA